MFISRFIGYFIEFMETKFLSRKYCFISYFLWVILYIILLIIIIYIKNHFLLVVFLCVFLLLLFVSKLNLILLLLIIIIIKNDISVIITFSSVCHIYVFSVLLITESNKLTQFFLWKVSLMLIFKECDISAVTLGQKWFSFTYKHMYAVFIFIFLQK